MVLLEIDNVRYNVDIHSMFLPFTSLRSSIATRTYSFPRHFITRIAFNTKYSGIIKLPDLYHVDMAKLLAIEQFAAKVVTRRCIIFEPGRRVVGSSARDFASYLNASAELNLF